MDKKKIFIVTYHFAHNYGAVLQAFATQTTLENLGYNPEILDYSPKYHTEVYAPKRDLFFGFINVLGNGMYRKNVLVRLLAAFKNVYLNYCFNKRGVETREEKSIIFSKFVDEFLNTTPTKYYTLRQIKKYIPQCYGLVSGSDQIWNWRLTNRQFDDVYFLQFGEPEVKRCIYAASLGTTTEQECFEHVKALATQINNISFREKAVCDRYNQLSSGQYLTVADPTMLLSAAEYNNISKSKYTINKPYILAYILVKNNLLNEMIDYLNKRTGYKVVEISPHQMYEGANYYQNIEPNEFPSFFKNAEYVITNSFHGTAFSLIYNRELFCAANPNSEDDRITSLLDSCAISERFIESIEDMRDIGDTRIDYNFVNIKLDEIRRQGIAFLKDSLS